MEEFLAARQAVKLYTWRVRLDFFVEDGDVSPIVEAMLVCEALTRRGLQKMAYTVVGPILSIYVQVGYPKKTMRFNIDYDPSSARTRVFNAVVGSKVFKPNATPLGVRDSRWIPDAAQWVHGEDDEWIELLSEFCFASDSALKAHVRIGAANNEELAVYASVVGSHELVEGDASYARITAEGVVMDVPSPLHVACALGKLHMVKALIRRGFAVDVLDGLGRGPFHYAARYGSLHVLQHLWKMKDAHFMAPDHYGENALMLRQKVVESKDRLELAPDRVLSGVSDPTMDFLRDTCHLSPVPSSDEAPSRPQRAHFSEPEVFADVTVTLGHDD